MIDLRDLNVQEFLLGRRVQQVLTAEDRRQFAGQRVMITGAGGTVGSELARQIAACRPARLTLFEQSEYNLFQIEQELADLHPGMELDPVLGDVRRRRSVRAACRAARPHVIYHAAAYKHVTMTERAVCQAVEANVFGTMTVTRAAFDMGARLVLISSDKAAQPQSVMGATKRLAELVVVMHACATFQPVVVRFGNILASSGSVVEVMATRLQRGLPLHMTDPGATRFFMTAQEAVSLVLKADLLGRGGEIYWLDMGEPVRLATLVDRLLKLADQASLPRVPVRITGLRPGEKLHEELTAHGLELCRTAHKRVWAAKQPPTDHGLIRRVLRALRHDIAEGDPAAALADLCAVLPEFRPSEQAWAAATAASVSTNPVARPNTATI